MLCFTVPDRIHSTKLVKNSPVLTLLWDQGETALSSSLSREPDRHASDSPRNEIW
jgi:hypothetical protein